MPRGNYNASQIQQRVTAAMNNINNNIKFNRLNFRLKYPKLFKKLDKQSPIAKAIQSNKFSDIKRGLASAEKVNNQHLINGAKNLNDTKISHNPLRMYKRTHLNNMKMMPEYELHQKLGLASLMKDAHKYPNLTIPRKKLNNYLDKAYEPHPLHKRASYVLNRYETHHDPIEKTSGAKLINHGVHYDVNTGRRLQKDHVYLQHSKQFDNEMNNAPHDPEKDNINYTGKALRENHGIKFLPKSGKKIDPNKNYTLKRGFVDNADRNKHLQGTANFRGSNFKKHGLNYDTQTGQKIDPHKVYVRNRKQTMNNFKNNVPNKDVKINYRGKFLKHNGINYDSETGEKIDLKKSYRMNRRRTESQIKTARQYKEHPYSMRHPDIGLKGDLKRKGRIFRDKLGVKSNHLESRIRHGLKDGLKGGLMHKISQAKFNHDLTKNKRYMGKDGVIHPYHSPEAVMKNGHAHIIDPKHTDFGTQTRRQAKANLSRQPSSLKHINQTSMTKHHNLSKRASRGMKFGKSRAPKKAMHIKMHMGGMHR